MDKTAVDSKTVDNFKMNNSFDKPSSSFDAQFLEDMANIQSNREGGRSNGGVVVCAVCGAVRYYSFAKQARKFGVCTCESCRKFISKMIRVKELEILKCNGNKGQCKVPPYVVNPLAAKGKRVRRCPACWLKQCLRTFNIPKEVYASLTTKLPEYMRDEEFKTSNITCETKLGTKKETIDYGQSTYKKEESDEGFEPDKKEESDEGFEPDKKEESDERIEPGGRQKRKAAKRFMENIARITGRITNEIMDPYLESRIIKKKRDTVGVFESFSISRKVKIKKDIKVSKTEDKTENINVKNEETNKIEEKIKGCESSSIQDKIKELGRPRLIILARKIDLSPEYIEMEKRKKEVNMNSNEFRGDPNE